MISALMFHLLRPRTPRLPKRFSKPSKHTTGSFSIMSDDFHRKEIAKKVVASFELLILSIVCQFISVTPYTAIVFSRRFSFAVGAASVELLAGRILLVIARKKRYRSSFGRSKILPIDCIKAARNLSFR